MMVAPPFEQHHEHMATMFANFFEAALSAIPAVQQLAMAANAPAARFYY